MGDEPFDGATVEAWAHRLAALAARDTRDPESVAQGLGVRVRPGWLGYAEVDPPPGIASLLFVLDEGRVRLVIAELGGDDAPPVPLADLEARLGEGAGGPLVHPGDAATRRFRPLTEPGAEPRTAVVADVARGTEGRLVDRLTWDLEEIGPAEEAPRLSAGPDA